jgi:hypothetical protein
MRTPTRSEGTNRIKEDSPAITSRKGPIRCAQIEEPRDAYLAAGTTFRADCDRRCVWAAGSAILGDLDRLLTYHDQYGYRSETLRLYAELPNKADRDWKGADLDAASTPTPTTQIAPAGRPGSTATRLEPIRLLLIPAVRGVPGRRRPA